MTTAFVDVTRGDTVESRHRVHIAVAHAERGVVRTAGDPQFESFVRSAIKMFQALPLVEDGVVDRFGLTPQEIALCCASHNAEACHVDAARSILRKADVPESALACGPHPPMHQPAADALAERGEQPRRIHNNCSGKHAGMLAVCRFHGWPLDGYHELQHPMQQRVLQTLLHWTSLDHGSTGPISIAPRIGIDGCGLPTFAFPLDRVALACARLAAAAADGAAAPKAVLDAMTAHPEYVAGAGRLDTDLMRVAGGRLFAKVGAEGYYCAGVPDLRIGLAIKVEDGAKRASEPALLAALRALDAIDARALETLASYARPAVLNTRGERIGEVRAVIDF